MVRDSELAGMSLDERFKKDTLMKVYERAESAELTALLRAAEEMFPGSTAADKAPVHVNEKPGWRRIRREDGSYEAPAYAIGGYMLDEIFIMADGTAYLG